MFAPGWDSDALWPAEGAQSRSTAGGVRVLAWEPCGSPGGAGCKRFAKWDRVGQGEFWNQGVQRADTLEGKTVSFRRVL